MASDSSSSTAVLAIATASAALLSTAFATFKTRRSERALESRVTRIGRAALNREKHSAQPTFSAESMLGGRSKLRTYYFLDAPLVMNLYSQIQESDLVLDTREVEETLEGEGNGEANISLFKFGGRYKKGNTQKDSFQFNVTAERALVAVERNLLTQKEIEPLALTEPLRIEGNRLRQTIAQALRIPGFAPSDSIAKLLLEEINEHRRSRGIEQLVSASGFVALQGDFLVESDVTNDIVLTQRLKFLHDDDASASSASIALPCKNSAVTEQGRLALKTDRSTRITCVGRVVRWDAPDAVLVIAPLAIY